MPGDRKDAARLWRLRNRGGGHRTGALYGLYEGLIYIGQTGRSLRERTMTLRNHSGRDRNNPPWNDPHTAAPALWAFRIENGFE